MPFSVPRVIVRALDTSQVFDYALTANEHPEKYGPVIALDSIESCFDAAKIQQRRIQREKISIRQSFSKSKRTRSGANLFYDVHFYLICWARFAKLVRFIRQETRFPKTGLEFRRFKGDLDAELTLGII